MTLPESIPARDGHTCGVTRRTSTSAQAAFFGGRSQDVKGRSQDIREMAETIVVDLGRRVICSIVPKCACTNKVITWLQYTKPKSAFVRALYIPYGDLLQT